MLEELVEKEIITSKQVQQIQEFYQEKKKAKSEKYANKRIIPMEESDMDSYKDKSIFYLMDTIDTFLYYF